MDSKENTRGKLLMLGGIDQIIIDHENAAEGTIRSEVRRAINMYAPGGAFLPCIASIMAINPGVNDIVIDECNSYGADWLQQNS